MPEGISIAEYNAFVKWYRGIYGATTQVPPNDKTLADLPVYQMWIVQGRTGFPMWTTAEARDKELAGLKDKPWGAPDLTEEDWQTLYKQHPYVPEAVTETGGIGAGTPSIVSINGYDFIQWSDEEGKITTDPSPIEIGRAHV